MGENLAFERGSNLLFENDVAIFYFFAINEQMKDQNFLGELELMILLAIVRLENETYGVPLARELSTVRGREVSLGSVYASVDRLEIKGLVKSKLGQSTPERGGRAKRYFSVTAEGLQAIQATRRVLTGLWKSLPSAKGELA
jgi:DNA-binding PadR family transcriptional regulator